MRILLDECVDWRLLRDLAGLDVKTVRQMGWTETKNGALLTLAATHFDVFVTVDKNLSFQQNIDALPFAVVVLSGRSSRLKDLRTLIPELRQILACLRPGEVRVIGEGDR